MLVSNYDQPIEFVTGFAGAGKSTELAKRYTPNWLVLTPTHKAKEVLQAKGIQNVFTIHSVLKLVPTLNQNMRRGQRMQRLQRIGDVDLSKIKHIAIDEFSMINIEIMDMLLDVLPATTEVTIFGDPYQLPPVDGEAVEPNFYTDNITELTTQHRAEAPEVVETFMRFMNFIKGTGEMDLTMNPAIKHGTVKGFNPATDRCLAYTNNKVLELNEQVANYLNLPKEISVGEEVSINGLLGTLVNEPTEPVLTIYPKCVSKGRLMTGAKLEEAIEKVEDDIERFGTDISEYPVSYIRIDETVYAFRYDLTHYANSKALKSFVEDAQFSLIDTHNLDDDVNLKHWCAENKGAEGVKRRGQAWSKYLAHQGLVWDKRRPFATTVHKSQGQEFHTVYIAQTDIKRAICKGYYLQYARLMYVALSRAIKKVVIVE